MIIYYISLCFTITHHLSFTYGFRKVHITEQTKAFLGDDYMYEVVRKVDDPVIQEMRLKTFLIVPGGSSVKRAHKNAATRNLNVARVTTYDGQRATPPSKRSSLSQGTATKVSMS